MNLSDHPYLLFFESESPSGKTIIVEVVSRSSGTLLGRIKWHGPWRQYTLHTEPYTIWNVGCLEAVNLYISRLMADRRATSIASNAKDE